MERVYNFAAGPATIDPSVLEKAQKELVCYQDKGMSVMEMSHRSAMYLVPHVLPFSFWTSTTKRKRCSVS